MRLIYLAGCVEYKGDTWREKTAVALAEMGFGSIDPMRNEKIKKVGKHLESDLDDTLLVRRDIYDLDRAGASGGLMLANLNTTSDGRRPKGTLFEMQHAYDFKIPVISVMGRDCDPEIRTHPFVKYCTSYKATSLTDALRAIEHYFK